MFFCLDKKTEALRAGGSTVLLSFSEGERHEERMTLESQAPYTLPQLVPPGVNKGATDGGVADEHGATDFSGRCGHRRKVRRTMLAANPRPLGWTLASLHAFRRIDGTDVPCRSTEKRAALREANLWYPYLRRAVLAACRTSIAEFLNSDMRHSRFAGRVTESGNAM